MTGIGALLLLAIAIVISASVVGALARWVLPGPDPMSWRRTILLGAAGSMVGGIVGSLFGVEPGSSWVVSLVISVACSAFFLWFFRRRRRGVPLRDTFR